MSFYELDENSPRITQPKGLKIKLRPHQLTSIAAMRELEKQSSIVIDKPDLDSGLYQSVKHKLNDLTEFSNSTFVIETNSAILADKVGSGKTFMVIGLILNNQIPDTHDRFVLGSDHFSIKMLTIKESEPVNLIVVPHNLANQWSDFMDKSKLSYLKLNSISDFDIFFDIDYVEKPDPINLTGPFTTHTFSKKKKVPVFRKGGSKTKKKKLEAVYERKILNKKKVDKILGRKQVFILNVNRYKYFINFLFI